MKYIFAVATVLAVSFSAVAPAVAQTNDDKKWVNQCLKDNADAKVSQDVVLAYCVCMNNKMDDNETRSISQWEKANPAAMAACEKASGWK